MCVFTQGWLNYLLKYHSSLSCLLYRGVNRLMNALEGVCLCLRDISINVNKLFIVVFVFCLCCPYSVVVACLLHYSFFILILLLYLCYVSKTIIFIFATFVYHFKNTISILVTIEMLIVHQFELSPISDNVTQVVWQKFSFVLHPPNRRTTANKIRRKGEDYYSSNVIFDTYIPLSCWRNLIGINAHYCKNDQRFVCLLGWLDRQNAW